MKLQPNRDHEELPIEGEKLVPITQFPPAELQAWIDTFPKELIKDQPYYYNFRGGHRLPDGSIQRLRITVDLSPILKQP